MKTISNVYIVLKKIKNKICNILRIKMLKKRRKKLNNKNFTIISQNCIGGVIYNELGIKFNSPTINLYFSAEDFLKFVSRLPYYLDIRLEEIKEDKEHLYPRGKIDDIIIHFLHYKNFDEAKKKWEERKKRVNLNNIYIIMVERDNCSYEIINKFEKLNYKHKVILTFKEYKNIKSSFYIKNAEENGQLKDVLEFKKGFSYKRYLDEFDYVKFLNNK